ncbi:MAG TPA: hypothetical protein DCS82_09505 [Rhodospirillaceae bacterium]|nr:hypothetical protein [Rhodospirillaceae bacterium]HAA91367.1 hypothetical protein [Rhodospirillaceae bacterium]HAT35940.1 hypothetical protein [Rhodospirillaceae bacterium]|tara:strand:- start:779 stop:1096 length:318 start_codon:yes stop_codon:yes gene_type:complete
MQTENRFFDDLARVANGAVGTLANMRSEFETLIKQRMERMLAEMDLVPREEFDAVKAVAAKAREEQENLEIRVAELEAALKKAGPKKSAAKPRKRTSKSVKPTSK